MKLPDDKRLALIAELSTITHMLAQRQDGEALARLATLGGGPQAVLPGLPPPADVVECVREDRKVVVARLFAYWQQQCEHPTAKLTPDRATAVFNRLREGYSEAEIRRAIDGAKAHAFTSPDSGKRYDDLELICRKGSKLEDFIGRGIKAAGPVEAPTVDEPDSLEGQIAKLRRKMMALHEAGRTTEYELCEVDLKALLAKRGGPK